MGRFDRRVGSCLSGAGVGGAHDPNDAFDLRFKALVTLVKVTMRPAYEEIVSVAESVRHSDRDWRIVPIRVNHPLWATPHSAPASGLGEVLSQ